MLSLVLVFSSVLMLSSVSVQADPTPFDLSLADVGSVYYLRNQATGDCLKFENDQSATEGPQTGSPGTGFFDEATTAVCNLADPSQQFKFQDAQQDDNSLWLHNDATNANLELYNADATNGQFVEALNYDLFTEDFAFEEISGTAAFKTVAIQYIFPGDAQSSDLCVSSAIGAAATASGLKLTACPGNTPNPAQLWRLALLTIPLSQTGSAVGDPQFTGFMGQSYQVHGAADTIYNILSTPTLQYNALFKYIESGRCRVGTPCFAHPGNYFGSVGLSMKDESGVVQSLLVDSGDVTTGLSVTLNNVTLSTSTVQVGSYRVSVHLPFEVVVESNEFSFRISNSDQFLNQDVSIGAALMNQIRQYKQIVKSGSKEAAQAAAAVLPHGILGQTWEKKQYPSRWEHIAGQLFDYVVADGINGKEFKYNRF